jgi:multiple sugar transport system permease protein
MSSYSQPSQPILGSALPQRNQRLSNAAFGLLLALPAVALFAVVILYPLVNSMVMAFYDKSLVFPDETWVGLKNVGRILSREALPLLSRTLVFTFGATLLPFVIGFGMALLLNIPMRLRGFLRGAFLLPWLIPSVVVSFLWMWIFDGNYGVINGVLRQTGLISTNINFLGDPTFAMIAVIIAKAWNTFPWIGVLLLAALQTIPAELYEAASLDGASVFQRFRNVTIPQVRGVMGVAFLLSFIWNFQHFETIYVMTSGGPAKATTTFAVAVYDTAFKAYDLGRAGAIGIVWMALLSVIVVIYLRFAVKE